MPKLAERYTTKYGFQCLEKNMTRFEAEHALQISPEPLVVEDINQYIVMANREQKLLYHLSDPSHLSWDTWDGSGWQQKTVPIFGDGPFAYSIIS